ncbi:MAG: hypothetical protein DCC71_15420 [Proteobacteria bacterium]|nr:MAG: hypothetical protein DCC71_15420 [Pseudomonadota bacterium]
MTAPALSRDLVDELERALRRAHVEAPDLADALALALASYLERAFACRVPGKPQPQQRARGKVRYRVALDELTGKPRRRGFVRMADPVRSTAWKGAAGWLLQAAMRVEARARGEVARPLEGPVAFHVRAVFPRAKADAGDARLWNAKDQGDADNVAKAALDAANTIAFDDDAQVARLVVEKLVAARGEEPHVALEVAPLGAIAPPAFRRRL